MENEIETLRSELSLLKVGDQATTDTLRQLLCGTRKQLDEERVVSRNLKKEIDRLCARIEELQVSMPNSLMTKTESDFENVFFLCVSHFVYFQVNIAEEHGNAIHQKTLAKEYHLQIQELRNKLTDTRFDRARTEPGKSDERFSSF